MVMDYNVVDMGFNKIEEKIRIILDYDSWMNANPPTDTTTLFQITSFQIVLWAETGQKLGFHYPFRPFFALKANAVAFGERL